MGVKIDNEISRRNISEGSETMTKTEETQIA
jgi:hypothetical protein